VLVLVVRLADALQEVQRLKSSSDPDKNGSSEKLASLLNELRDERDKVGVPSGGRVSGCL
jgi:hypothetical protein